MTTPATGNRLLDEFERIYSKDTTAGTTAYKILAPHIALSCEDVALRFDRSDKRWHVEQVDGELRWEASGNSQFEALLALIACRYGLHATFVPIEEDYEQP